MRGAVAGAMAGLRLMSQAVENDMTEAEAKKALKGVPHHATLMRWKKSMCVRSSVMRKIMQGVTIERIHTIIIDEYAWQPDCNIARVLSKLHCLDLSADEALEWLYKKISDL
jgi:hypothetical protein